MVHAKKKCKSSCMSQWHMSPFFQQKPRLSSCIHLITPMYTLLLNASVTYASSLWKPQRLLLFSDKINRIDVNVWFVDFYLCTSFPFFCQITETFSCLLLRGGEKWKNKKTQIQTICFSSWMHRYRYYSNFTLLAK